MAVNTVPDGLPTIPILATTQGNQLYAFLKQVFQAELLDRHDTPAGEPAYMTIRIGDSVISVMRPLEESQPTRSRSMSTSPTSMLFTGVPWKPARGKWEPLRRVRLEKLSG